MEPRATANTTLDRSAIMATVDDAIDLFLDALCIAHFDIHFDYQDTEIEAGRVFLYPEYERALIGLNPVGFASHEAVLDCVWHELLHVLHIDFETVRIVAKPFLESEANESLGKVFELGAEKTVRRLQRVLRWRKFYPDLAAKYEGI